MQPVSYKTQEWPRKWNRYDLAYLRLHPAARFDILERFSDDLAEILETSKQDASVDVIEGIGRIEPILFSRIVDYKLDIVGNPLGS
jgi:hypothetical protein